MTLKKSTLMYILIPLIAVLSSFVLSRAINYLRKTTHRKYFK